MKRQFTLIFFVTLFVLLGCSKDGTDRYGPKPVAKWSAPTPVKADLTDPLKLQS